MPRTPPKLTPELKTISENVRDRFMERVDPTPNDFAQLYSTAADFAEKLDKEENDEKLRKEAIEKRAKFNEKIVEKAFKESGGQCQCTRKTCDLKHQGRCLKKDLKWEDRGPSDNPNAWQAHHRHAEGKGGADSVSNCEILCVPCHKSTDSFGRPG